METGERVCSRERRTDPEGDLTGILSHAFCSVKQGGQGTKVAVML